MEFVVLVFVSGIVASYAYGCGTAIGARLARRLNRREPTDFER